MRTVAVVNGNEQVVEAARKAQDALVLQAADAARLESLPASALDAIDVVVVGPSENPVAVVQQLRAEQRGWPVVLCYPAGREAEIRRAVAFSPFIPGDIVLVAASDQEALRGAIDRASARAAGRRRTRAAVRTANVLVATGAPLPATTAPYLERLMEIAPVGVLGTDAAGRIVSANACAADLLGSGEPLAGQLLLDLFEGAARDRVQHGCGLASAGNHPRTWRFEHRRRGRSRHLEATASTYATPGGGPGLLLVLSDITRQHQAELARQESEQRLHLALVAGRMGIWHWDTTSNRVTWSESLEDLYGIPHGSFAGTLEAFLAFVHPDDRTSVVDQVARAGLEGPDYGIEFRIIRPDGELRWIADRGQVLFDEEGRRRGMTGVCWDNTEQRQAEAERAALLDSQRLAREEAEQAVRQLRSVNEELEGFVYMASHDLQEPLRTVGAFAQLLERRYKPKLDEGAADIIDRVVSGVGRMRELIDDLLDYSRVNRGEMQRDECVDTAELLRECIDLLGAAIAESAATIRHGELPQLRQVNGAQIRQVLANLLSNAIKYRRPGVAPEIDISAEVEGGCVHFRVCDNGEGFAPEYAEKIFGVFQRLHGREVPGTGLGLAMCRRIAEKHGGRMWAEGRPGEGACFHFTLPRLS